MKHHLTPLTMAMIWKNKNITNVGKDVEKRKHFYPVGRNVNWYSHLENSVEVPLKVENRTTMRSSDLTSGYTAKNKIKSQSQRKICTPMFIIALCTIAKVWKKSKCPSTNAWIKKMWYIYKMEYHPVFKKKGKTLIWDMDESKGHYMMWNKPDTGKTNITWSHLCMKY